MEKQWHYLVNQFLNATFENFKKALKLSNYHDARLKKKMDDNPGDPDFATLYNRYHILHLAYVDAYNQWKLSGGVQGGQTLNMTQLLLLLITKINKWEGKVSGEFEKTSVEYKTLFPNGKYPFNSGAMDTRIAAVLTLGSALTPYGALAAVKADVDAFYTLLDAARDTQEGAKGGTKDLSTVVEQNRVLTMTGQYQNLGFLMNKFAATPLVIAPFFELNILRNHLQVLFTGTLDANETEPVLIHTFVGDDELRVKLEGNNMAEMFLASTPGGTDSQPILVQPDTDLKHQISEFGPLDLGVHRYITFRNTGTNELHYEIELL